MMRVLRSVFYKLHCNVSVELAPRSFHTYPRCFSPKKENATTEELKKTPLYQFHIANGGKMVEFAKWSMPVQYAAMGIKDSHLHTRKHASLFDVSHMLQSTVTGADRVSFMETLVVGDIAGLKDNQGTLTLFTNDAGTIMDDLIVTKTTDDHLYVVSNAACAEQDLPHMQEAATRYRAAGHDVTVEPLYNGLVALQGPESVNALQSGIDIDLKELTFMYSARTTVFGVPDCRVTRCGYTGEDGVEISVAPEKVQHVAECLLDSKDAKVALAGLGVRDSLRVEAGLCLYGSDIDTTTTPIEAQLTWTIGKRRRSEANFPGAGRILQQLKDKPTRKRIGLVSTGPPARRGSKICMGADGSEVGEVTSGCYSPSLQTSIAMGYVSSEHSKAGTALSVQVRNKMYEATVTKMPFVPAKYYTGQ